MKISHPTSASLKIYLSNLISIWIKIIVKHTLAIYNPWVFLDQHSLRHHLKRSMICKQKIFLKKPKIKNLEIKVITKKKLKTRKSMMILLVMIIYLIDNCKSLRKVIPWIIKLLHLVVIWKRENSPKWIAKLQ